jgi:hypothetical protein
MSMPFAAPNTDRTTVLALGVKDIIVASKGELEIQDVFYGNHTMTPRSPTVVIRPGRKQRALRGVAAPGGRTENELTLLIDVMSADVLSSEEDSRLALDQLAENVEKLLYVDVTIGGLVIHGFVTDWDPGEIFINNSKWRTVRMTYRAKTITYLSPPAAPA